ncbi:MAG: type II secretion system ATPase GspE [Leptospiraceae bacterium]|nr:type II secretion system ATPase GspE [Leptospiraceae bacterium]MDW8307651.1 type II secretion system ATPase GspE [Leptospiraceae bacterium]
MKNLSDILLEEGLIDKEELKKAISLEKKSNLSLAQVLIKRGIVSEDDVLRAQSKLFGIPFVERLEPLRIDEIIPIVPLKFVQKYRMVPYSLERGVIRIALSDPTAVHPLDEFRLLLSQYVVEPVIAREGEILRIIHNYYEKQGGGKTEGFELEEGLRFLEEMEDIHDSMDLANQAPIIKMVNVILSTAVNERASDIHIEPMEKELVVRFRIDGIMHRVLTPPKSIQNGIISRIKIMANLNIAENRLPQDGRIKIRFSGKEIDIRVSCLPTVFGERVVMRLLNKTDTKFDLATIGFDQPTYEKFVKLLSYTNGIILITGPTGSGKTTTLYAALSRLNDETRNIITVEDPVEYQIPGISQVQARHKIGLTFAEGLRSILRQDPDVIMVGEIRDEETARVAIQASLTGHLVFSTLHTNDAPSAVTRLLDMGIEPYLITSTCRGFMAQRLVRKLCPSCKKAKSIKASDLASLGYPVSKTKKTYTIYEGLGCKECMQTGYRGRTGVYELLVVTNRIREVISANPTLDEIKKVALQEGMVPLRVAALQKVVDGETSLDEALRVT